MIPFNVNNSSKHASRTVDTKRLFQTTVGYTAWDTVQTTVGYTAWDTVQTTVGYTAWDTVQEHRSIGLYSINGWGREITIIPTSSPWLGWSRCSCCIPVYLCNPLLGCIGCYFFVYQSKVIVYWAVFTWILGVASKQLILLQGRVGDSTTGEFLEPSHEWAGRGCYCFLIASSFFVPAIFLCTSLR